MREATSHFPIISLLVGALLSTGTNLPLPYLI